MPGPVQPSWLDVWRSHKLSKGWKMWPFWRFQDFQKKKNLRVYKKWNIPPHQLLKSQFIKIPPMTQIKYILLVHWKLKTQMPSKLWDQTLDMDRGTFFNPGLLLPSTHLLVHSTWHCWTILLWNWCLVWNKCQLWYLDKYRKSKSRHSLLSLSYAHCALHRYMTQLDSFELMPQSLPVILLLRNIVLTNC